MTFKQHLHGSGNALRAGWPRRLGHPFPAMIAVVFIAGGMSGGNCASVPSGPGNPGGGGGGESGGPTILADDHILGSANAKVTVVEYEDFS